VAGLEGLGDRKLEVWGRSVKEIYGVSDEEDGAEHRLSSDAEEGDEKRDAGVASDATWAKRWSGLADMVVHKLMSLKSDKLDATSASNNEREKDKKRGRTTRAFHLSHKPIVLYSAAAAGIVMS
jgi:hypothetical protein